jgi:hypothetical protein
MNQETIRQLLNGRNIQVSDEHLVMLEALMGGIDQMRAALDGAPPPDSDIGLIHALEEPNHD